MKVAVTLAMVSPRLWPEVAVAADELGYESVWIPEHLVLPVAMGGSPYAGQDHPPIPPDLPVFDPLVQLAFLAARTSRVRLGTQVFNIGLRHPFVTARAVATLDVVSGGRVELGLGASWLEAEWQAVGLDFHTRGRRVDEAIDVCRRLWSEPVVEHHGRFFDFPPVMFEPKPVQPGGPPLVIGGDSEAAMRRAVRVGAGWMPMNHTLDQLPAATARLEDLCAETGRSEPVRVTIGADGNDPDQMERCGALGIDRVIVRPWKRSAEAVAGLQALAGRLGLRR